MRKYPILYSLQGHRYCDLLLGQGQTAEVLRRATQALRWAEEKKRHRSALGLVFGIVTGGGMRLHFADCYLAPARLALAKGDREKAHAHVEKAADLVRETAYRRRDPEVVELRLLVG